jgi:hypothetical protein
VATIAAPHSLQNLAPSGFSWPFGQVGGVATIAAPHSLQNLGPSGFSWPFGQVATTQPSSTAEIDVRAGVDRRRVEHGVAIFLLSPPSNPADRRVMRAGRFVSGAGRS